MTDYTCIECDAPIHLQDDAPSPQICANCFAIESANCTALQARAERYRAAFLREEERADALGRKLDEATEFIDAMQACEGISSRDGSREDPHIKLKFKDFADAHRAHRAIHALALSTTLGRDKS